MADDGCGDERNPLTQFAGYRLLAPLREAEHGSNPTNVDDAPKPALWRAVRVHDDAPVVIKVFARGHADLAERESGIAEAIGHPHVLRPVDLIVAEQSIGLVLPWCAGGSLADLLVARHRVEWPEALTVLIPLADALAAAHERGFLHGDVSCANVMFDEVGRPLLADFGAARAAVESGTPVWVTPTDVAPEIVRGAVPSAAADLFSLGSVALACLTGRSAWLADDLKDVMIQSAAGQWPSIEDTMAPAPLCTVVRRLLDAHPSDRGSAAELAVELRHIGKPEPVHLVERAAGSTPGVVRAATMVRPDALRPPAARGVTRDSRRGARVRALSMPRGVEEENLESLRDRDRNPDKPLRRRVPWWGWAAAVICGCLMLTWIIARPPGGAAVSAEPDIVAAGTTQADTDWLDIVLELDEARSQALIRRDPDTLAAVYTPGSPGRETDAERIDALRTAGLHVTEAGHSLTGVEFVRNGADGAVTIAVTGWQRPYAVLSVNDEVLGRAPAAEATTVLMELAPTPAGYRIRAIAEPDPDPPGEPPA